MIERYASKRMRRVWGDANRLSTWRQVEIAVAKASALCEGVPPSVPEVLEKSRRPEFEAVERREADVRHDVVAFLQCWAEANPGVDAFRWLHYGMTSSDLVDTALSIRVRQAGELIYEEVQQVHLALLTLALRHQDTFVVGRTHGRPAEITTVGYRFANFTDAALRAATRFIEATEAAGVAKVSGPVGTYAHLVPDVERRVAKEFQLVPAGISTQVVMRDRLADWAWAAVQLVNLCEAIATEVRLGAHLGELSEYKVTKQVGSSAMAHKSNPISSEKVCGLARYARGLLIPLAENGALWHERDISHSSVERTALPDLAAVTEHVLATTARMLVNIEVDAEAMADAIVDAGTTLHTASDLDRRIVEGEDRWKAHDALANGADRVRPADWYMRNTDPVFERLRRESSPVWPWY